MESNQAAPRRGQNANTEDDNLVDHVSQDMAGHIEGQVFVASETRVAALTAQFDEANHQLTSIISQCRADEWQSVTQAEGWSVAVTAHHVAIVQRDPFADIVNALAAGEGYTPNISMEEVSRLNAVHARKFAGVGKDETLEKLDAGRLKIAGVMRSMDDALLDQPGGVCGGNELTVEQVLQFVIIGHVQVHLDSIRDTLSG